MKIVVVDGQGGRIGAGLIEALRQRRIEAEIIAVGANSHATAAMLGAKADAGATGENACIVNCRDADYILGPVGIIVADALHGEVTPAMATAVGQSRARKILLPVSRCNTFVAGVGDHPVSDLIQIAVRQVRQD